MHGFDPLMLGNDGSWMLVLSAGSWPWLILQTWFLGIPAPDTGLQWKETGDPAWFSCSHVCVEYFTRALIYFPQPQYSWWRKNQTSSKTFFRCYKKFNILKSKKSTSLTTLNEGILVFANFKNMLTFRFQQCRLRNEAGSGGVRVQTTWTRPLGLAFLVFTAFPAKNQIKTTSQVIFEERLGSKQSFHWLSTRLHDSKNAHIDRKIYWGRGRKSEAHCNLQCSTLRPEGFYSIQLQV